MVIDNLRNSIKSEIEEISNGKSEALNAANDILALIGEHRVVCASAETQMGKTTICKLVCLKLIHGLKDDELLKLDHKVVAYIENVANNDLVSQAAQNFESMSNNVDVLAVTKADNHIESLPVEHGILFIVDESHMGSDQLAKRLNSILSRIEDRNNPRDRILLVSATGFSSIYETAKEKSIMGYKAAIKVVAPSSKYRGIQSFIENKQVIDNSEESCLVKAKNVIPDTYNQFIKLLKQPGAGLYIIRSTSNQTSKTKDLLLSLRDASGSAILKEQNIKIVATKLNDVEANELDAWDDVIGKYKAYKDRGQKLVIIVRGYLRVGIAMPHEMKQDLTATWDGTSSAVSSVVQALIGRACGYHDNSSAIHFANKKIISAHNELNKVLTEFAESDEVPLSDIALSIQKITENYGISNWDPGLAGVDRKRSRARIESKLSEPQFNVGGYGSYSFNPNNKLFPHKEDIYELHESLVGRAANSEDDDEFKKLDELLRIIHHQYHPKGGEIRVGSGRRLSLKNVSGQYINKNTFINPKHGQRRKLEIALSQLAEGDQEVSFNDLRTQGAGKKKIEVTDYIVYILSVYNTANLKKGESKTQSRLTQDLINKFCDSHDLPSDENVVIIFRKGVESEFLTKQIKLSLSNTTSQIVKDGNLTRKSTYMEPKN